MMTRVRSGDVGTGGTGFLYLMEQQPSPSEEDATLFDFEYRRETFQWAAREIHDEFQPSTWEAFWRMAVEGRPIKESDLRLDRLNASFFEDADEEHARTLRLLEEVELIELLTYPQVSTSLG